MHKYIIIRFSKPIIDVLSLFTKTMGMILLYLASEKDILASLDWSDIVNRFDNCSDSLRRHVTYAKL